jgi:hypothetical protein
VVKLISKTISITIPKQLEESFQKEADNVGISRSRFICNILLQWQENKEKPINDCANQQIGWCSEWNMACKAPQSEAETCADYSKKE